MTTGSGTPVAAERRRITTTIALVGFLATVGSCIFGAALRVTSGVTLIENRFQFGDLTLAAATVLALSFAAMGALLGARRPRHPVGWLLLATGLGYGLSNALVAYVSVEIAAGDRDGRGVWAAWLIDLATMAAGNTFGWALAVFPDGRLPIRTARRWLRPILALAVAGWVAWLLRPGELWTLPQLRNPASLPVDVAFLAALRPLQLPFALLLTAGVGLMIGVLAVARARSASGLERQQLKWFALAAAVALAALTLTGLTGAVAERSPLGELPLAAFMLSASAIPVAIAIAILRHRLYDIDVVIRRTLVYSALVAVLGVVYVVLVLGLQPVLRPVAGESTLAVALSTLMIAALFGPVRARVRGFVDRRFYRTRYDAGRTLDRFSRGVRDEVAIEAVRGALVDTVNDAVAPSLVMVWLRPRRSTP